MNFYTVFAVVLLFAVVGFFCIGALVGVTSGSSVKTKDVAIVVVSIVAIVGIFALATSLGMGFAGAFWLSFGIVHLILAFFLVKLD